MSYHRKAMSPAYILAAALGLIMIGTPRARAEIINVPADYPTIQQAIDAADPGDEVIVAEGEYIENIDFLGKAITVRSTDPENPDVVEATIINGDAAGSVVTCDSGETLDTVLTGFTITNGDAFWGGGMYNENSSPTVAHCIFRENVGYDMGGGMRNKNASPSISDCAFIMNSSGSGGGMNNFDGSNPTVIDCKFSDNVARVAGGGMINGMDCSPLVVGCTFSGNAAVNDNGDGGAIYNSSDSYPMIAECSFVGNTAMSFGGAVFNIWSGPMMLDSTFVGNYAPRGGALLEGETTSTTLNCTFIGNWADYDGGAIDIRDCGEFTIANCTLTDNWAPSGAGVYNWNSSSIVANCTFSANAALHGIIYNSHSDSVISNCIVWGNDGSAIYNSDSAPIVTYSNVEGGYAGEGNIDANPLFVDPDNGDFRLAPGSPCIDAADNTAVPPDELDMDGDGDTDEPIPFDLDGNLRFVDDPDTEDTGHGEAPIVDMGAYEFQYDWCPADFDDDGDVDTADLLMLLGAWGECPHLPCPWDFNGDGVVDDLDRDILMEHWGDCPDPPEECPWDLNGDGVV
ncbi:MAG: right-handed parallel beta-helix repeat-containing protein, partial [Planctomycetota bacterium]|nr:right-handed parallel beta-helix repeat-containing protein [Planctomycetota bacterium]